MSEYMCDKSKDGCVRPLHHTGPCSINPPVESAQNKFVREFLQSIAPRFRTLVRKVNYDSDSNSQPYYNEGYNAALADALGLFFTREVVVKEVAEWRTIHSE